MQEKIHRGNERIKDLNISGRVNGTTYKKFKTICSNMGISPNACLNMIITDFVRQNIDLLSVIDIKEED